MEISILKQFLKQASWPSTPNVYKYFQHQLHRFNKIIKYYPPVQLCLLRVAFVEQVDQSHRKQKKQKHNFYDITFILPNQLLAPMDADFDKGKGQNYEQNDPADE